MLPESGLAQEGGPTGAGVEEGAQGGPVRNATRDLQCSQCRGAKPAPRSPPWQPSARVRRGGDRAGKRGFLAKPPLRYAERSLPSRPKPLRRLRLWHLPLWRRCPAAAGPPVLAPLSSPSHSVSPGRASSAHSLQSAFGAFGQSSSAFGSTSAGFGNAQTPTFGNQQSPAFASSPSPSPFGGGGSVFGTSAQQQQQQQSSGQPQGWLFVSSSPF